MTTKKKKEGSITQLVFSGDGRCLNTDRPKQGKRKAEKGKSFFPFFVISLLATKDRKFPSFLSSSLFLLPGNVTYDISLTIARLLLRLNRPLLRLRLALMVDDDCVGNWNWRGSILLRMLLLQLLLLALTVVDVIERFVAASVIDQRFGEKVMKIRHDDKV